MNEWREAWRRDRLGAALAACWLVTVFTAFFGAALPSVTVPLLGTMYPFRILLPATAVLFLIRTVRTRDAFWKGASGVEKWCWVLAASMLLYGGASLFRAIDVEWTFRRLFNLCFDLCFFLLMLRLCRNRRLLRGTLWVCGAAVLALCVMGVYEIFHGGIFDPKYDDFQRLFLFTGLYQYPTVSYANTNNYASALAFCGGIFLLAVCRRWEAMGRRRLWLLAGGFAVLYFLSVCSDARLVIYAMYLLLAGLVVFLLVRNRKQLWVPAVMLLAILCVQFVVQYRFIVPPIQEYLEELRGYDPESGSEEPSLSIGNQDRESMDQQFFTTDEETGEKVLRTESSNGIRARLLLHAFRCMRESHFLGVGLGNTEMLARDREVIPEARIYSIHCFVARILADFGIFVLIPLCAIALLLLKRVLKALADGLRRRDRETVSFHLVYLFVLAAYPLLSTISSDAQDILPMWIYLAGVVLYMEDGPAASPAEASAMRLRTIPKKIVVSLFSLFPVKRRILLESVPCYADNTRAVFEEMLRRDWSRDYEFIWMYKKKEEVPDLQLPNVRFCKFVKNKPLSYLYAYYLMCTAKLLICCNNNLPRQRTKGQYSVYLAHGAALKDCRSHSGLPDSVDEMVSFSSYLAPYDAANQHFDPSRVVILGYPRTDMLFEPPLDTAKLFPEASFSKLIYWLPTYRQSADGSVQTSDISMPILYNEEIARQVNDCAREQGVLVVVKPHFAQDISRIKAMRLSNLVFIDEAFLRVHGILNYDLLRSADAMLSDYSSVYYDYLLLDRPIGLCWDDYEEYIKREGIIVDQDLILAGGEKLYNAGDLCGFITRLSAGEDLLREQRAAVRNLIHHYQDGQSAKRVVDYLEGKLAECS